MKNLINNLSKLFIKPNKEQINDLTPKGIKSTIKSKNHGTPDDFNKTWIHIVSQTRNIQLLEKEHNIKIK